MIRWLNVKQPEPVRYFESNFFEKFTYLNLRTVWTIWLPISLFSLFAGLFFAGKDSALSVVAVVLIVPFIFLLGLFRWSLIEYLLHRFILHYSGNSARWAKIASYAHGMHHEHAMLKTRVATPLIVGLSINGIIAFFDWIFLGLIANFGWFGLVLYAGTSIGYLAYNSIHWAVHFIDTDWRWYKKLRSHHMRHHRFQESRFGVTSTLWDHVFKTYPESKSVEEAHSREESDLYT